MRNLSRFVGGAVAAVAVAVGGPVLLVALSRALLGGPTPFSGMASPGAWTWSQVADMLTSALAQDVVLTTLARAALVVAWAALACVVVSIVIEVGHLARTGHVAPTVKGLGWSQAVGRRIAAGLLAVSTLLPTNASSAATLPVRVAPAVIVELAVVPDRAASSTPDTADAQQWTTYTVQRGDSVYGIANRISPNDRARARDIARAIIDRNLGRMMGDGTRFTTPGYIETGWVLDVPHNPSTPRLPVVPAEPAVQPDRGSTTVVVERNDSYWSIAEDHLETTLGRDPSDSEVLDATRALMDLNAPLLGDRTPRSLIHPGEVLVVEAAVPQIEQPAVVTSTVTGPTATALPPPTTAPTSPLPSPPATAAEVAPASLPAPVTPPAPTTSVSAPPTPDVPVDSPARDVWRNVVLGGLLATGLGIVLHRSRARRLANRGPGERLVAPSPIVAATAEAIRRATPGDRIAALATALDRLRPDLGDRLVDAQIRAVELGDDEIELLWRDGIEQPSAGWSTVNGGHSWTAPYPAESAFPERALAPALVGLGRRNGNELLADLETIGSLSVVGPDDLVLGFVSQLALTLTTSPLSEVADVLIVGGAVDAGSVGGARRVDLDTALRWVRARAAENQAWLAAAGSGGPLGARARLDDELHEPTVVIVHGQDPDDLAELVGLTAPASGLVLVVAGEQPGTEERIVIGGTGAATWLPHGIEFEPSILTAPCVDAITETLAEPGTADVDDRASRPADHAACCVAGAASATAVRPPVRMPQFDVIVNVLGEVTVTGAGEALTPAERELLALLAIERPSGPINLDRLTTLLSPDEWATTNPRSVQQRLSVVRTKLGTGRGDEPLVPAGVTGRGSPGLYTVSDRVGTDVELIEAAYRVSLELSTHEAIDLLVEQLPLLRGVPFTARAGYGWAHDHRYVDRAAAACSDLVCRLLDLAADVAEVVAVNDAVDRNAAVQPSELAEVPVRTRQAELALRTKQPDSLASVLAYVTRIADQPDLVDLLPEVLRRAARASLDRP